MRRHTLVSSFARDICDRNHAQSLDADLAKWTVVVQITYRIYAIERVCGLVIHAGCPLPEKKCVRLLVRPVLG